MKNCYYIKSDVCMFILLFLLRIGGIGECWMVNLKVFVSCFLGFSLKRIGMLVGSKGI